MLQSNQIGRRRTCCTSTSPYFVVCPPTVVHSPHFLSDWATAGHNPNLFFWRVHTTGSQFPAPTAERGTPNDDQTTQSIASPHWHMLRGNIIQCLRRSILQLPSPTSPSFPHPSVSFILNRTSPPPTPPSCTTSSTSPVRIPPPPSLLRGRSNVQP